jgi:hypothetical protein
MSIRLRAIMLAVILAILVAAPLSTVRADISPTTKEEIKNLAKAAREIAEREPALHGPLVELLIESDDLICEAWIIKSYTVLRDLTLAGASPELIDKAQQLQWRIERACAEEDAKPVRPKPPVSGDDAALPADGPGAFHPRPGWTIEQEICARRCADLYATFLADVRIADSLEKSATSAQQLADDAAKNAADLDTKAAAAESARAAARAALAAPITGTPGPADVERLRKLNRDANVDVEAMKAGAAKAHADADDKAARAKRLAERAKHARAEAEAALKAYNDCITRCLAITR